MNATDSIRRVSVVSTGQVQIRPDHEASARRPMAWWLLASRRWTSPRPIDAYVIEHRDGLVLFDTGQDRALVTDRGYFPGGMTGCCTDVTTAVLSHLHQDHIGGLAELGLADIRGQPGRVGLSVCLSGWLPEMQGLMRRHIDLPGLRWQRITPEPVSDPGLAPFRPGHDLFGGGSLVLLPTLRPALSGSGDPACP